MNAAQRKKAGCRKCQRWRQGSKSVYPLGFCIRGGRHDGNATALEKIKKCHDAFEAKE